MLYFLVNLIWWLLSFVGVYRDLPPIPDARPDQVSGSPKKVSTPTSNKDKHVTFSPVKDFIPDYGFGSSAPSNGPAPAQLMREVHNFEHTGSEQVTQLLRILCDASEELEDAQKEHSRLVKENNRLREKELTDSRKSENE